MISDFVASSEQTSQQLSQQPSQQEVQELFNQIAPMYDRLNDWLSLGQHRVWKKMAIAWTNPKAGDTYLDLCCGSGDVAMMLARKIANKNHTGQVFGVDFSESQLAIACHRTQSLPHLQPYLTWQQGDALHLEFPDQTFDGATLSYGLRNVLDIPKCLAELYRVLKPKAVVAILDFHRPSNPQTQQFQQFYLNNLVVPIAKLWNLEQEYAYLMPSLQRFPIGSDQVKLAIASGFSKATHYPILAGLMGILVLTK
ncbi:ubiquinone/menaquinone biosynthesis methyltransferase [Synechococcus sp. PCC 7502]|uniref:bifunctional demethylmenaquinone methyltransferase/2-methoxy-6-polyprenyl-1,4-benzoquinol methylase UbiE n=1 Tax=Synechococcus sp. PCC 7502 TaxID=1173263 RepID=UPI00029F9511|nr:bifunctional demethylmenaquinone methyltransferase/2-methoxy-6-polyprenyl-1,4-benzoquinol methylase UbiE [Synechococcus sp. PCC 7502]AFY72786.1 ubiquinone/menaquinone biosynthesis methyltransferase [Synechococcus sp. PCC 7502]